MMDLKKSLKLSSLMLLVTGVIACSDSDKFNFDTSPVVVNPPPVEEAVEVKAENDNAEDVNGSTGATAVVNVLANDTVDGEAATTSNADLDVVTADAEGLLTLSAEGNVNVAANSAAGSYSLEYQICEKGTSNCDSATVSVVVVITEIKAVDDVVENANGTNDETAVTNVLTNDTLDGEAVAIDEVDLSVVTPDPSGSLTLNADGTVVLAAGTSDGNYQLTYKICEKDTENCSEATVSVTVDLMIGVFMKGMGQGIAFETDTISGVTNDLGEYSYLAGESITFLIGATELGETVEAQAELDVTDLVPGVTVPEDVVGTKQMTNDLSREYGKDGDERRKQFELINMMSLLFSVDKDKDSSNGIQIDPKLHEAFANNSYSFKEHLHAFSSQYRLQRNLFDAYNNGAVENARIINHVKSLDLLYEYLDLDSFVFSRSAQRNDYGNDGTLDYHYTWSLDSQLMLSAKTNELSGQVENHSYNVFGQEEEYSGSRYQTKSVYNIHGQETRYEYDRDGDGIPDRVTTREYDVHGNYVKSEFDNRNDGVIDRINSYEYDENSNQIKYTYDSNADGVADSITINDYDDKGNRISSAVDNNADGTINELKLYSYDTQGNMITYSHDIGANGTIDRVESYEFDARGNRTLESYDNDGDGVADVIYRSEYDANNNVTMYETDNNGDGVPDMQESYENDENGNQTSYMRDDNADRVINFSWTREYDANQALTLIAVDNDGDGIIDSKEIYENDNNGATTKHTNDNNNDGTPEQITEYVNDNYGNPLNMSEDTNADGTINNYYEYEYQQTNFTSRWIHQ